MDTFVQLIYVVIAFTIIYVWIQAGENGQPSYYNVPNNGTDSVMPNEYAEIGTNSTKTPQVIEFLYISISFSEV